MLSRARVAVAPAYLLLCLVLGGSAQGVWQNMILQLAGVAIIAWAASDRSDDPLARPATQLLLLAAAFLVIVVLQLVPLPASVWSHLGPRQAIAGGYRVLGIAVPSEPLSVAPASTLDALLKFIPPLAIFCAMVRLRAYRPGWLALALIGGTVAAVALGALQVASSGGEPSGWYLYEDTNPGAAVGFFANRDHMGTLLIAAIPFLAALVAAARTASMQRYSAVVAIAVGIGFVLVVGIALNSSLAGYGLALPVVAASLLLILPPASRLRLWVVLAAAALMVGAVIALETTAIGSGAIGMHASSAVDSRSDLLSTSLKAAADYMPFGSGFGTFQSVFPLYEQAQRVNSVYVVHAHNDYAELVVELGLAGVLLIAAFLLWWIATVARTWRTAESSPFARAAAIASAAMLVHSFVDFPLRTAAMAACFGMCMAFLADSRAAPPKERKSLRRKRHVEFK